MRLYLAVVAEMNVVKRGQSSSGQRTVFLCLVALFLVITSPGWSERCPFCNYWNTDQALTCARCLRAVSWTARPPRSRPAAVVVRTGIDTFIRGPNDWHPSHQTRHNAGADSVGPIGSYYSLTGLRYLIKFDIPRGFAEANLPMADFVPSKVTLVLHVHPAGDGLASVPILIYPLKRPFSEGSGRWGTHWKNEDGATWLSNDGVLSWHTPGGDFYTHVYATSTLPRKGAAELAIDVTDVYQDVFARFRKTGVWEDYGLIIMRDPFVPDRCQYRFIYSFEAAPDRGATNALRTIRSPELYIE